MFALFTSLLLIISCFELSNAQPYTLADVQTHNSAASCFFVVSGIVYDVTNYANSHPGGANAITRNCGTDATSAYISGSGAHPATIQTSPTNPITNLGAVAVATVPPTTTIAPTTTKAPTTLAPTTTKAPTTTLAPTTTKALTTLAPTTLAPTTTKAPTTLTPTTLAPTTTKAPTTTLAPTTTRPPTTIAPTTIATKAPTTTAATTATPTTTTAPTTVSTGLTASQVATHNTATDCYFIISGIVYSVTAYISGGSHPGGQPQLTANCGTDATTAYRNGFTGHVTTPTKLITLGPVVATPTTTIPTQPAPTTQQTTTTIAPTVPPTVPPTIPPTVPPTIAPTVPPTVAPTVAPTLTPSTVIATGLTAAQVATHNTATDCYFIISGIVYNVNVYIASNSHPGGQAQLTANCGTDATSAYRNGFAGHVTTPTKLTSLGAVVTIPSTTLPTTQPTAPPTTQPTAPPTTQPTAPPTTQPTAPPTQPTAFPSTTFPTATATTFVTPAPTAAPTTTGFTAAQVATHNTPTDCFFIISAIVYDATAYIASASHPGGQVQLTANCGTDATSAYRNGFAGHVTVPTRITSLGAVALPPTSTAAIPSTSTLTTVLPSTALATTSPYDIIQIISFILNLPSAFTLNADVTALIQKLAQLFATILNIPATRVVIVSVSPHQTGQGFGLRSHHNILRTALRTLDTSVPYAVQMQLLPASSTEPVSSPTSSVSLAAMIASTATTPTSPLALALQAVGVTVAAQPTVSSMAATPAPSSNTSVFLQWYFLVGVGVGALVLIAVIVVVVVLMSRSRGRESRFKGMYRESEGAAGVDNNVQLQQAPSQSPHRKNDSTAMNFTSSPLV